MDYSLDSSVLGHSRLYVYFKEFNMNKSLMIKTLLWMTTIICLYNIITTFSGLVFSLSGFMGIFTTWTLLRWDEFFE